MRDKFTDAGYFVVRSASSKGVADLVAIRPTAVALVQCKTNGVLAAEEWDILLETAARCGALPVFARKDPKGHIELFRLLARKIPRAREQPMELFTP